MPGVLIVEALAQAGAVILLHEFPDRDSRLVFFAGIDEARFRRPVFPGDTLRLEVEVLFWRNTVGKMVGRAYVGEQLAAEATLLSKMVKRERARNTPAES